MKKWLIIIGSVILLTWLAIRGVRMQTDKVRDKQQLFIEQLDYDFAGVIDSVLSYRGTGDILFHITRGKPERSHEQILNKRIKGSGTITFLKYRSDTGVEIMILGSRKARIGDSIIVNSDQNKIRIMRGDSVIIETDVSFSIRSSLQI